MSSPIDFSSLVFTAPILDEDEDTEEEDCDNEFAFMKVRSSTHVNATKTNRSFIPGV